MKKEYNYSLNVYCGLVAALQTNARAEVFVGDNGRGFPLSGFVLR